MQTPQMGASTRHASTAGQTHHRIPSSTAGHRRREITATGHRTPTAATQRIDTGGGTGYNNMVLLSAPTTTAGAPLTC